MKIIATFAILLLSVPASEAKSSARFCSSRDSLPVTRECRAVLQLSPKPKGSSTRLTSIALSQCPGTTGKCLRAVRVAVQKSKGMPLEGDCLSAKDFAPILVQKYGARRLGVSKPSEAPIGSILVYGPRKGGSRHGHVEIVTSKGYISDHVAKKPYSGPLIGAFLL